MKKLRFITIIVVIVISSWRQASNGASLKALYYEQAYNEISDMLDGKAPLSIKRAVFLAEWAFLDGQLDFNNDFCIPLSSGAEYMRRLIKVNKWTKYTTSKQIALCNFFFYPCSGNGQNPFRYDFSNLYDEEDWRHQLVSVTLKTHKGRCHSMPWAFLLYAEELGADVSIAHAPRHCFIMYKDLDNLFTEDWVYVEVTSQQYQPSFWIKEHFEITDAAIAAGTYLTPLTKKHAIACQLADLAFSYQRKFGKYDEFTYKCVCKSLQHYPMNPNAIIIRIKSLEQQYAQLVASQTGNPTLLLAIHDEITSCVKALRDTHWTEETPERKKKWSNNK